MTTHTYVIVTSKGSVSKTYRSLEKARRVAVDWMARGLGTVIIYRDGKEFETF